MRIFLRLLLTCTLLSIASTAGHAANLILDGGFETPTVPPSNYTTYPEGALGSSHWKVIGYDVRLASKTSLMFGRLMSAHGGQQWLNLAGSGTLYMSGVQQTVPTTIGQNYVFSMWVGALKLPSGQNVFSKVEVYANGKLVTIGFNLGGPSTLHQNWRNVTGNFTATSASTEITILNGGTAANIHNLCSIDDVSLN